MHGLRIWSGCRDFLSLLKGSQQGHPELFRFYRFGPLFVPRTLSSDIPFSHRSFALGGLDFTSVHSCTPARFFSLRNCQGPLEGGIVNYCYATALTPSFSSFVKPRVFFLFLKPLFALPCFFLSASPCLLPARALPRVAAASNRERCVRWPRLTSRATCGASGAVSAVTCMPRR